MARTVEGIKIYDTIHELKTDIANNKVKCDECDNMATTNFFYRPLCTQCHKKNNYKAGPIDDTTSTLWGTSLGRDD